MGRRVISCTPEFLGLELRAAGALGRLRSVPRTEGRGQLPLSPQQPRAVSQDHLALRGFLSGRAPALPPWSITEGLTFVNACPAARGVRVCVPYEPGSSFSRTCRQFLAWSAAEGVESQPDNPLLPYSPLGMLLLCPVGKANGLSSSEIASLLGITN